MNKFTTAIAALTLLPTAGFATVIGFGDFAENTVITDQFAAEGVNFRGIENGNDVDIVVANFPSLTGNSYLSNCFPLRCVGRADVLEITFDSAASNVSFELRSGFITKT